VSDTSERMFSLQSRLRVRKTSLYLTNSGRFAMGLQSLP